VTPIDRAYVQNLPRAHGFEPLAIEGKLPPLEGTLYRTGPGLFDSFGRRYGHLFEGDGAITAVRVSGGRAEGATRILATTGLLEERSAGRPLYGSAAPWLRRMINTHARRMKNTANTNVLCWQRDLLALVESSPPTRIDRERLTVIGETDLGGALKGPLSAHPHRVPSRCASYGYGVRYGRQTKLDLYELPDRGSPRLMSTIELKHGPMLHDFMATENHLVFFVPPAVVSVPRALLQIGSFEDLFQWRPKLGTLILVIPIDRPEAPIRFRTDSFFQWHFANGFERDGRIYVDFLHHDDFSSFVSIGRNEPWERGGTYRRAEIDPSAKRIAIEPLFDEPADFPRIHPAVDAIRNRYTWLITRDPPQHLVRLDLERGSHERFRFDAEERAAEAVIAPVGPGELDGFAITMVYDGKRNTSGVAVFDARSISGGPVARAWFDHHIPITFHGTWLPR
jgi:all-trans-8'-apo-beta-carotenal 15,15'-oxygenase